MTFTFDKQTRNPRELRHRVIIQRKPNLVRLERLQNEVSEKVLLEIMIPIDREIADWGEGDVVLTDFFDGRAVEGEEIEVGTADCIRVGIVHWPSDTGALHTLRSDEAENRTAVEKLSPNQTHG